VPSTHPGSWAAQVDSWTNRPSGDSTGQVETWRTDPSGKESGRLANTSYVPGAISVRETGWATNSTRVSVWAARPIAYSASIRYF
ncbi:uncharacterized protein METZ01_LOCUS77433, partial [marine metagenome]